MKKLKIKLIIMSILFCVIFIIMNNKSYAATSQINVSSSSVTVGDTITVTISANAASWNVKLISNGPATANGTTIFSNATESGENENVTIGTVKYTTTGSGPISFSLSGQLVNSDYSSSNATGSATVQVAPVSKPSPQPSPQPPVSKPSPQPQVQPSPQPPAAPTFSSVNETVYATTDVNVRSSYSTSSSSLGQLKKGNSVTRTGVSSTKVNGYIWSKVTFNGKTGYIASNFLTTTKPEIPTSTPTTQPSTPPVEKSNDSTLKTLSITGVSLTPEFNPSITSYTASVEKAVTEVEVIAEVNNEKAKYEISGNKELKDGENKIIVAVTAEDGTITNYEIKLIKGDEEIPLDAFSIVGIKENDERVDILLGEPNIVEGVVEYTINLSEFMKSIDIQALYSDDLNQYEGIGKFDLVVGENKFTVVLKQQIGEEQKVTEYRITINNPEKVVTPVENNKNEINYVRVGICVAVAVVAVGIIIFAIVHYKKQDKVKYGNPDYSFLNEDDNMQDINNSDKTYYINNHEGRRKGGRHF